MEEELHQTFKRFATFGNRVVHGGHITMDSRAFQKLCKDARLTGRKLTTTDLDLLFAAVKPKGERKIDFIKFLQLTQMVAIKLNRSHAEVAVQISATTPQINSTAPGAATSPCPMSASSTEAGSPSTPQQEAQSPERMPKAGSAPAEPRAMPRLHPDWYEVQNPNSTSETDAFYYVNRITNETTWKAPLLVPTDSVKPPPPPPPPPAPTNTVPAAASPALKSAMYPSAGMPRTNSDKNMAQSIGRRRANLRNTAGAGSASSLTVSTAANDHAGVETESKHCSIFERLTDPKLYTGAHKHRFDASTGKGLGLGGRDSAAKGAGAVPGTPKSSFRGHTNTMTNETVHSLAQVLRSSHR